MLKKNDAGALVTSLLKHDYSMQAIESPDLIPSEITPPSPLSSGSPIKLENLLGQTMKSRQLAGKSKESIKRPESKQMSQKDSRPHSVGNLSAQQVSKTAQMDDTSHSALCGASSQPEMLPSSGQTSDLSCGAVVVHFELPECAILLQRFPRLSAALFRLYAQNVCRMVAPLIIK